MFNRNSPSERVGQEESQSSFGSASSSGGAYFANSGRSASSVGDDDDELEPAPFRDGATLQLSSNLQGRSVGRPLLFMVAQPPEQIEPSWMARVDRIIGNRSHEEATISDRASAPVMLSSSHQEDHDVFAQSSAAGNNNESRTRLDEQLLIEAPVDDDTSSERAKARFRPYQRDQWDQQYKELLKFRRKHGHCHIPHTYEENPALSRWAKRQRYQYKRKLDQKQSAMSDVRQQKLDEVGFVWDLQTMVWQERYNELVEYKARNGNCNVPCRFDENPTLGMWVKCQRRQYKLFQKGELSRLTPERFQLLTTLGFTWDPQAGGTGDNNNSNKTSKVVPSQK